MSTQTLPIHFESQNEDDNEVPALRNQKVSSFGLSRSSSSFKANPCQINSPNHDLYTNSNNQQYINIHHLSNNCATLSTSSFENETNEQTNIINSNSIMQSRSNIKSTPTTPTPLSTGNNQNCDNHHHQASVSTRFASNQQPSRLLANNQIQSPSYISTNNSQNAIENHYSLTRNDDYLISNFRPFNANSCSNQNSFFRPGQSVTAYVGQTSVPSTSNNNSRVYNAMNALSSSSSVNYSNNNASANNNSFNHLNQRTNLNSLNSSINNNNNYPPSNGTNNYNGTAYYRQKDLESVLMMVNDVRNQTGNTRHPTNSYNSPSTPIANSYSRSNTVINNNNWKITNGMNLINDKNDFTINCDDQDHYSNRRDTNG